MNLWIGKATPYIVVILVALMSGCAGQQTRVKSSVVDYLYPKESNAIVQPSIPVLNLPIKVGIAFVPEQPAESRGINFWSDAVGMRMGMGGLTEVVKADLLEQVAENFRSREFVSDIEVIPSAYLTAGGSFSNLEQIQTMYGIDVIALVSYDQVQFTDTGALSLTYWTLVGAYVIEGEENDTSTMLDTVVYDIKSKKMLFRAPGTSNIKGKSAPINLGKELRTDSLKSFEEATKNMVSNLDIQLDRFRDKIKQNPEQVKIVHREGYSGGGSVGLFDISIMALISGVLYRSRKRKFNHTP